MLLSFYSMGLSLSQCVFAYHAQESFQQRVEITRGKLDWSRDRTARTHALQACDSLLITLFTS